jgi:hypothetical protein
MLLGQNYGECCNFLQYLILPLRNIYSLFVAGLFQLYQMVLGTHNLWNIDQLICQRNASYRRPFDRWCLIHFKIVAVSGG